MDYAQRHEYVKALEEERGKIMVFQRELPLCLDLVNQTIEACKRELSGTTTEYMQGQQSECSEQTTCDGGPVLEEFIPIKRSSSSEDEDEEEEDEPKISCNTDKKKSDWLRSVQLWNSSIDLPINEDVPATVVEVKKNGGAFQPFQKQETVSKCIITKEPHPTNKANPKTVAVPATSGSSTEETGGKGEDKDGQHNSQRKQRRCWSPELHRRFLHALQQLGGSHSATPKQIRELMKVDGLTNDEVKSHLQKYRLHTRRPNASSAHHNNGNPQAVAPQFLVVGGIWVPPPEYATIATTTTLGEAGTNNSPIFAPIAAPPPPPSQPQQQPPESLTRKQKRRYSEHMVSDERGHGRESSNNSTSTSSSTHTTTTSPTLL